MRIRDVQATVVRAPTHDALAVDNTHEAAIIQVFTDEGVVGIGEASASPPAVKAIVDEARSWAWGQGLRDVLIGEDPSDPRRLWDAMYQGNWWSCRTGVGHVAMAAVDMALWDLAGKASGLPVWRLLGSRREDPLNAYITIYQGPTGSLNQTIAGTIDLIDAARRLGYRAAKIEALPDTTKDEKEIVQLVRAVREGVGDEFELLCDVGYRWRDVGLAIDCVGALDEFNLFLLEAPLPPGDLDGYSRLSRAVRTPIAGAEILTSHDEFRALMDVGGVDFIQPATSRVGITETCRLATEAHTRECKVVMFGWVATALALSASLHVAAVSPNVPWIEYAPPSIYPSVSLRRDLVFPEPTVHEGVFELPEAPGLGVSLNERAFAAYRAG